MNTEAFPLTKKCVDDYAAVHQARSIPDYVDRGMDAYCTEMLPLLFGGEWQHKWKYSLSARPVCDSCYYYGNKPRVIPVTLNSNGLFDHSRVFRRKGTKGPLNWANGVITGHPYGNPNGMLWPNATEVAPRFARMFGVSVWARKDLSIYFPGQTVLVIASPELNGRDPTEFGFVDIGREV
jgi:hypothetical protein